ncbi:hypothetical protein [Endozoicomonas lisbonensis]|uniref:Uncharacterized protein n=1 Tax=Endozoicomonas lisbonensis TaxID=3120522 RepID=A0ABV2SNQ6_9GAMM
MMPIITNEKAQSLLIKIVRFNHAWKSAQRQFGQNSGIATALRDQKACLQAELLRHFEEAYLASDQDVENGEELYSVRLFQSRKIDGLTRSDVEHMPVRIAKELFTEHELRMLLRHTND